MGFPLRQAGRREHKSRAEDSDSSQSARGHLVAHHLVPATTDFILKISEQQDLEEAGYRSPKTVERQSSRKHQIRSVKERFHREATSKEIWWSRLVDGKEPVCPFTGTFVMIVGALVTWAIK